MIQKYTTTSKNNTIKNVLLVALLFVSTITFAQPGSLDPTFNTFDDGTRGDGSGFNGTVYSTAIQPDGKIIVGGDLWSFSGTLINNIVRLNANGTIDTSFNAGSGFDNAAMTICIQADGKIIVGGYFSSFNGTTGINRIVRLNANGTRDITFNAGTGFDYVVNSISIQSDGKIIVGGGFTSFNGTNGINRIIRLNTNGTQDITFNAGTGFNEGESYTCKVLSTSIQADGKITVGGSFTSFNGTTGINNIVRLNANGTRDITFNAGTGFDYDVNSISIQADGKIVGGGQFTSFNRKSGINRIVRLNANGTQDTTFNSSGGFSYYVNSTSIQADGKIIVGGSFKSFNGMVGTNHIVRLLTNGTLDTTFKINIFLNSSVFSTTIQADGKIIVGGYFTNFNDTTKVNKIVRLDAIGSRDTIFNSSTGFNNIINSTSVQTDGKIILGGDFTSFNGKTGINRIVRLHANGNLDTSFNIGTGFNQYVTSISIQADGKIIVAGDFTSYNGTTGINRIVRLQTNGMRDTTFNVGTGFNNAVNSISIQTDGKIIVGGSFLYFNGSTRINGIIRLHVDGTRDTTFNAGTGFDFNNAFGAFATSIQTDGKIILGGDFTSFNGTTDINHIIRLHTNGTRDTTFNVGTGFNNAVNSISIQADGKIIVGGDFTFFNGKTQINRLVRLNINGTQDITFNAGTGFNKAVKSTSIQADGKIIVGGSFTSFNGKTGLNSIVRIHGNGAQDINFNTSAVFNNVVNSTSIQADGKIIVGGDFTVFNGKGKNRLARLLVFCIPIFSSQNATACDTFKWSANNTTYTTSGIYIAQLTSATKCDSTITLNLTINKSTIDTQNATECDTYTWLANGNTYTNSGTYTAKLTNAAGCDSTIMLNLTINKTPVLTTSVSGATITANETGATYQWIDCNNANSPILDATSQSFTAIANGSYAVIVTKNTCSDTSACVNITNVGVPPITSQSEQILIFPNPNNGAFTISAESGGVYNIQNSLGQIIQTLTLSAANNYNINIENLSNGIYFVTGYNNNRITQQKVVVTN